VEVEVVGELGSQAAARSIHCLVGEGIIVAAAPGEVCAELIPQTCVGPDVVVDSDF
jgi:hypothetical protein